MGVVEEINYRRDLEALDAMIEQFSETIKKAYMYQSEQGSTDYRLKVLCRRMMVLRGELRELRDSIAMDLEGVSG